METKGNKLRDACTKAVQVFKKTNQPEFRDIASKLEFCVGSYDYDKNPSGLIEYGHVALGMLKEFKKNNPRKVSKIVIQDLEDSLF